MAFPPRRSALYLPASNARALAKARELPCDVVIVDLEDAVAPDVKDEARDAAIRAAGEGGFGDRELVLRVNGLDTPWGAEDLRAVTASTGGFDAVLLPKVSNRATLAAARNALGTAGPALWAMVETCRGVLDLPTICAAPEDHQLKVLVAGTNDLAKEMRCRPGADRAPLLPSLAQIVLAARAAGLAALDGVCNVIDDEAVVAAECEQGLAWGLEGKTLIHPAQIAPANRVFTPSATEVAWARRVAAAFDDPGNAGRGVLRIDGRMVELLHAEEARRLLAIAVVCGVD